MTQRGEVFSQRKHLLTLASRSTSTYTSPFLLGWLSFLSSFMMENDMNSTAAFRSPLEALVEDFANQESFESFNALPESHLIVESILKAVQAGQKNTIQALYTEIDQSSVPEISSLTRYPHSLLATLLAVSITREDLSTITLLLSIDPPPRPDLKRFLGRPGAPFSTKVTLTNNPQIRSLLVRHGYQKIDRFEVPFDQKLYETLLARDLDCLNRMSQLLEAGAKPKMAHLRAAMKFKPISVFELLLKHYPSSELHDCRLLHDAVQEGKLGNVRYLIDVVGINIDMFPTERPEQETQFGGSCAGMPLEPNGTPMHEAVRYRRKLVLQLLLEKGARIDIRDEDGRTPIEVARKLGATDIVLLLEERNVQVSIAVKKGLKRWFGWVGRG